MAVLTDADFAAIRKNARSNPDSKREYLQSGLTKTQWKAAVQELEDWFESERAAQKTAMDSAGVTLSNALAKKIGRTYYQWKWGGE